MSIKIQIAAAEEERNDIIFEKEIASFAIDSGCLYIEINGMQYYFDDSTGEGIVERSRICDCGNGVEEGKGFECMTHEIETLA